MISHQALPLLLKRSLFLSLFMVTICFSSPIQGRECIWTGVERIIAVGDVHGDHQQFIKILRAAKVINKKNDWIAGKTHLVQTGDILDRGPDSRKVMDLLMKLEKQARAAGGYVHPLIGNHEAMNVCGDLRYVHDQEVAAYGGREALLKALSPTGRYGRWICSHNTVIKINDVLFVHGGLGPRYARMPLLKINETIRQELSQPDQSLMVISKDEAGPLWYRGLVYSEESALTKLLNPVRKFHQVRRIVVGHTVSKGGIRLRNNGRVIMIDVGMSKAYGGPAACLLIEHGQYFAVYPEVIQKLTTTPETVAVP
ncbi:metallophosphoesterase [candidate division CSSED10-310 bacterium]|uniref:Metallophosphoesterase n=1 Tax=candidate division CSSED10-310 bacterium TaxID=2855610 RepID=A0ABV6Z1F2_UNCC1